MAPGSFNASSFEAIFNTPKRLISLYESLSGSTYDGWWVPIGILEIGRALGYEALHSVLQGCLPTIRVSHLKADFYHIINLMEKAKLVEAPQLSVEQITKPGTVALALSYRHIVIGDDVFPRRRMNDTQKGHLIHPLGQIAEDKDASQIVLWIDQVMGQRKPLSERDWVRNGILPYFAFDILVLNEQNDRERCWLFLEKLISETCTRIIDVSEDVQLYEKTHEMGTITPIQKIASQVVSGILLDKDAYNEDDKEQIRRWSATLLRQNIAPTAYAELVAGSSWGNRIYGIKGLVAVINNHTLPYGMISWRDVSSLNASGRWHGLTEMLGVPDVETLEDTDEDIREILRSCKLNYVFKVFELPEVTENGEVAIAIAWLHRSVRSPRVIVCMLDGVENNDNTCVVASCILDADNLLDKGAADFLRVLYDIGENDAGDVDEDGEPVELRRVEELFSWPWFASALEERGITELGEHVETLQAGDVYWG